jgi:hypothetical protein
LKNCSTDRVGMLVKAFDVGWRYYKAAPRCIRSLLGIHLLVEVLLSSLQGVWIRIVECVEVVSLLI